MVLGVSSQDFWVDRWSHCPEVSFSISWSHGRGSVWGHLWAGFINELLLQKPWGLCGGQCFQIVKVKTDIP